MSFKTQVEDIVGVTISDTSALSDFLTASAREVADILPTEALLHNATIDEGTTDGNGYNAENKRILGISRDGYKSVEVPFGYSPQLEASSGSIYEPTDRSPFHYYKGKTIFIKPDPTGSKKGQVFAFAYPTVAHGDTSGIASFPDNAEFAVTLGASCKYLLRMMSDERELIPAALSLDDITISTTAPTAPALADNSITFNQTAPVYTPPVASLDITQLETFLETEEDGELAKIQLGRINSELNEYQSNIQNELNNFNELNAAYQAQLQVSIQNAQLSNQDDAQKIQKYSQEIAEYSATTSKDVQEYQANLSQKIQEFGSNLQRNQAKYQMLSSQYQQCEVKYQAELKRLSGAK